MELNNNSVSLSAGSWMPFVQWLRPGWLDNSNWPERGFDTTGWFIFWFLNSFPWLQAAKMSASKSGPSVVWCVGNGWSKIGYSSHSVLLTPHNWSCEAGTRPSHEKLLTNVAEKVWKRPIPWGINVATAKKLETSTSLGRPTGGGRASCWCLPRGCSWVPWISWSQCARWALEPRRLFFGQLYKCTDLWVSHWNKTWQRSRLPFLSLGQPNICYGMCQVASQEKVYIYIYRTVSNYHPNNLPGTLFVCWPTIW